MSGAGGGVIGDRVPVLRDEEVWRQFQNSVNVLSITELPLKMLIFYVMCTFYCNFLKLENRGSDSSVV